MNAGTGGARFYPGPLGDLQACASAGTDFVFTQGMTGHDAQTGRLVRDLAGVPAPMRSRVTSDMVISDVPDARIRAQTLVALDHVRRALQAANSSLTRLVTLRLFLRDMRDSSAAAQAVKAVLGDHAPATTVVAATASSTTSIAGSTPAPVAATMVVAGALSPSTALTVCAAADESRMVRRNSRSLTSRVNDEFAAWSARRT